LNLEDCRNGSRDLLKCFEPDYLWNIRLCLLLRERSQAEQHFGALGERLGGNFVIGVSSEIADDDVVDRLTILTAIDFNTPVFALEDLNGGQSFRLESIESLLQALHIIVTSVCVSGTTHDAFFEHIKGTFKVEHSREVSFPAEDLIPPVQIRQGTGKSINQEFVLSSRSGHRLHRVPEQSHHDVVGYQFASSYALVDRGSRRPSRLTFGAEEITRT